ncbi:MAG: NPCBM/NEW2 domain-containing protein [Phycisphaerae bacterium]
MAVATFLCPSVGAAEGEGPAAEESPQLFTAREQGVFNDLYKQRIAKATSRKDKEALAKELLTESGSAEGGLRYLLLTATRDLANAVGDLEMAVTAAEQIGEMKRGDPKTLLGDLLDLQLKCFQMLSRKRFPAKEVSARKKQLYALGEKIVDNAVTLGNMHRADAEYAEAEKAEKSAERTAELISSARLSQLRQGILMSQTLRGLVDQAKRHINLNQLAQAQWEYLDAGLYAEAARLKPDQPDETAELLMRVGLAAEPKPADLLEAAKAWDKRSLADKGALQQIRMARAAELYQKCIDVGDEASQKIARLRLQAIEKKLGDLLVSLKRPAEWVYLVDMKEVSASVGWGSFGKITRGKGPIGIAGKNFDTGLSVHASSKVVYSLRGRYRQLSFHYGLRTGAGGVASLHVLCDGKAVFNSPWMWSNNGGGVGRPTIVNVTGVDKLELVTTGHRGGQGAHSAWGDPKVR